MSIITGIVVATNDIFIGRDQHDSPVHWASRDDQVFYLTKVQDARPIGIMGKNTYGEVSRTHKKSIYSELDVVVLDDQFNEQYGEFSINPANDRHIYSKIDGNIRKKLEAFSGFFNNDKIFILGGPSLYSMFLPFYDVFYLTVEKSVNFQNGIKLFDSCNNIDDCIKLFESKSRLKNYHKIWTSEKTDIYKFTN